MMSDSGPVSATHTACVAGLTHPRVVLLLLAVACWAVLLAMQHYYMTGTLLYIQPARWQAVAYVLCVRVCAF